ncbi:MAG: restriction endonuclease subunit S [Lachnospiraceae bacterium]|nr:restriction endonuclease subunit S [Lachnospiraceae bacterium]
MEQIYLKDICDLDNGYAFKSDDYVENSNTLNCRMSNIRPDGSFDIMYSSKYLPDEYAEKYKDYLLNDGDLIIAMTDMAGDPKILGVPTVVNTKGYNVLLNQRVGRLRFIKSGVNADYLKLALQSPKVRSYLKRFAGGGVQLNVSKKDILNTPVLMRNEEEKTYIADLFKRVIRIKKQRVKELGELDNLIKSRFVEMFGDPVTNPKNLPIVSLGELSELITKGASPSWQGFSYTEDSSQTLFITSENVREGYIDLSSPKYIEDGFNEKQKRSILYKGDFLINIVGASIGRAAQFNLDCKANMNQAAALVRVKDKRISNKYLLNYLNSEKAQMMYNSMKSDTGRANLSLQDIAELSIMLPLIEQQINFEKFVEQVDKSKFKVQKSLEETQKLMDSLMQQYFG